MKEFFISWGNFIQVIVALIFGFISLILWYLDSKKTTLIKELQTQTFYLTNLVKMVMDLSKPGLLVSRLKDRVIEIENIGDDMYELNIPEFTVQNIYRILNKNNSNISKKSVFNIRFEKTNISSNQFEDELYVRYSDKLGKRYLQILKFINDKNAVFEPQVVEN